MGVQRRATPTARPVTDSHEGILFQSEQFPPFVRIAGEAGVERVAEKGETGEPAHTFRGRGVVIDDFPTRAAVVGTLQSTPPR